MDSDRYDVIIVGGGVAGCAAAKTFADQGRRVIVVERHLAEPDRIVGELLQPGGVAALSNLGLGDCIEDIDTTPLTGYCLFWKGEEASFWLGAPPTEDSPSKPAGRTFRHGPFLRKLRERIEEEPNVTLVEGSVVELIRDDASGGVTGVICGDELLTKYYADVTILCDGATSNFRAQFLPYKPKSQSRIWGLELIDANLPCHGYAYSIIGSGYPMLMYQINKRETRILIDIPNETRQSLVDPEAARQYITEKILHTVPESVQPSFASALKEGRLRSVPSRRVAASQNLTPGLVVVGDALNMRHPLTGAGMTIAFKDVLLLADLLKPTDVPRLSDSKVVLEKMQKFHWQRKRYAASLNMLAQALYLLFAARDQGLQIMQAGFIRYIQKGEKHFAETATIMGGMAEHPTRFFYHFIWITLYSIGLHLYEAGLTGFPFALVQSFLVLLSAIRLILPAVVDELKA